MIHVVGNAAIDTIYRVERLPLPGETVIVHDVSEDLGGKGANQAVVAARAGAAVRLVAAIGEDADGALIRTSLTAEGVATDGLSDLPVSTDRSMICIDREGENTIVSLIRAAQAFDPTACGALERICKADTVLCQGNLRPEVLAAVLSEAKCRGARTVLNPSPLFDMREFDWRLADIVVLNRVEAAALSGVKDVRQATEQIRSAGPGTVVATLGSEGALMVGDEEIAVAALKAEAVDTTGAGDVFCGVLTALRAGGVPWAASLEAATEAATLSVTRRGVRASFPTAEEIGAIVSRPLASGREP